MHLSHYTHTARERERDNERERDMMMMMMSMSDSTERDARHVAGFHKMKSIAVCGLHRSDMQQQQQQQPGTQ